MGEIVTTNQLTAIHGVEPVRKKTADLKRGYIVYLEMFGPDGTGGIYARTFYVDYSPGGIEDQLAFEKTIIAAAKKGDFEGKPATRGQYPEILDDQIQSVDFGWRPCRVSYILRSAFGVFVAADEAQPLIQPVVFRRDKVVIDPAGKASIQQYLANNSFFNLETDSVDGASVIRFDNLMLISATEDALGDPPADFSERLAKRFEYCMDIHIQVDQQRLLGLLTAAAPMAGGSEHPPIIEPAFLGKTTTIVFDPPQTNGGGSGPPDP